jgi:short subunit dehydrogenase-like uncharacterized protein
MAGRIILFGATGYTGDLTARALVDRGAQPVLAARSEGRVRALAEELGGLPWAVADVDRGWTGPGSIAALVEPGDVLVSCVGPFVRWGEPAVRSAVAAGAHYIDSTGETPFIRRVFEEFGPGAQAAGTALLTAMGYDWVPGNLAGALALREAGANATRVEIGYFFTGRGSMSGGTRASAAAVTLEPSFAWRDGRLTSERGGRRGRSFTVGGRQRPGISVGSTEHFSLPRVHPALRDVDVYLGWFGPASPVVRAFSASTAAVTRIPGARAGLGALLERFVKGSTGGPDAEARAGSGSVIVAEAKDADGHVLAETRLEGANGYDFTAGMLAWSAQQAAAGGIEGTGALGPVEAFGLDRLRDGVRSAGIGVAT